MILRIKILTNIEGEDKYTELESELLPSDILEITDEIHEHPICIIEYSEKQRGLLSVLKNPLADTRTKVISVTSIGGSNG